MHATEIDLYLNFQSIKLIKSVVYFCVILLNIEKINRTFINFYLNKPNSLVSGNLIGLPYHHD